MTNRVHQAVLWGSTLLGSWLGMQVVHEAGHVVGAWATGGRVERVVLYPLTISRTDLAHNPQPLLVVWAGPLFGILAPLLLWLVAATAGLRGAFVLRFFAGCCLLANGLYIGLGSLGSVGDCGEMLRHGSPIWLLWMFGLVTAPAGLALWNGQGRHFGLGPQAEPLSRQVVYGTLAICMALVALGVVVGGR